MGRPAAWFLPFALVITLISLPVAFRDPVVAVPPIVAAVVFGAHLLYRDRSPGTFPSALLTAMVAFLALIAVGIVVVALAAWLFR